MSIWILLCLSTLISQVQSKEWEFDVDGSDSYIKVGMCAVEYREVQRIRYVSLQSIVVVENISDRKLVMFDASGNAVFTTPNFLGQSDGKQFNDALVDEWYGCLNSH